MTFNGCIACDGWLQNIGHGGKAVEHRQSNLEDREIEVKINCYYVWKFSMKQYINQQKQERESHINIQEQDNQCGASRRTTCIQ
ncbi:hypothetical protein E2C01_078101 [Portunus trituberculatus]|uniref:Uncharacterized protein n=1 Tax=Portunus trituberculatus TaxID=210409 RepID=A0A5B7IHU9_PORTR|nr:hypothetical protein [Portunus trituberculatus]